MLFHVYFRLMAVIFDLSLIPLSVSVQTSSTELLISENVGVAFGISLISCIEAEILRFFHFYFRFLAAIFVMRLTPTLHSVQISPVVFIDHKNAGLVVRFLLPHCIESRI